MRAVFYLDITDSDVERATELIGQALRHLEHQPEENHLTVSAPFVPSIATGLQPMPIVRVKARYAFSSFENQSAHSGTAGIP